MMTYTVIYEQGPLSWGAYVPDLPGVVSVGDSREEVERLILEAIELRGSDRGQAYGLNQEVDGDGGRLVMTTEDDAVSGTGYSTPKLTREALGDFGVS